MFFQHRFNHIKKHFLLTHGVRSAEGGGNYNPSMIAKPIIGEGDTGRYGIDAFQIAFNSPVGGGTIPGNSPATINEIVLNFQSQYVTTGGAGSQGTIPSGLQLAGLAAAYTWKG